MSTATIRVVLFGFGVIGTSVLRLGQSRPGLEFVGIVVRRPELDQRLAREVVTEASPDLRLSTDGAAVLRDARPDVVIVATSSTLREVLPQLRLAAEARVPTVCTAEDLAHIRPSDGPEAREIFDLADQHRVAIVALGLNPGFILDVWPLMLSSLAHDVAAIEAERVVDLSGFGPRVRASLGIGYSPADFARELAQGKISGHRGFPESLRLIGEAIGRPVDEIQVETKPIIAQLPRALLDGQLLAGQTAGVRQMAVGRTNGTAWLQLAMTASVALEEIPAEPIDRVRIKGSTELSAVISPGTRAVAGTAGRLVNALPAVRRAAPGVHSPLAIGITPPHPLS